MNITKIIAREILDSRGNPTVEADVILEDGSFGRAAVPSGASTGSREARELRDRDEHRYGGLGVLKAIENIHQSIAPAIVGMAAWDQQKLDETLIGLDGTPDKSRLGANAILAVSLAVAKAQAIHDNLPLYLHIARMAETGDISMPLPMMNILNGGKHALGSTDIQEFMIIPVGARNFTTAVRMGAEVFHALKDVLHTAGYSTTVGDEGGFAPAVKGGNEEALQLIVQAIAQAGYAPGRDFVLAIDVAATELRSYDGYVMNYEHKTYSSMQLADYYAALQLKFPIVSIEDGLGEKDWEGWRDMTAKLGRHCQLVGDDLLVTNTELLATAINERTANAILIKPNQIGTLTETIKAVQMAKIAGWRTIMSHRSGETEDTTIAHLAVGLNTQQIKTGSLARGERTAKYNELMRIEGSFGIKMTELGTLWRTP